MRRRLRPNIVVEGVEGLAERDWPGGCLRVGEVLIGVPDLRLRCSMTSFDPDTLAQDKEITLDIYRRFAGKLALNCFVIEGGTISVGEEVTLVRGWSLRRVGRGGRLRRLMTRKVVLPHAHATTTRSVGGTT